jgi:hypothetical protein
MRNTKKIITYNYLESFAKKNDIPFLNYNLRNRGPINDDKNMFTDWGHLDDEEVSCFLKFCGGTWIV